MAAKTKTEAAVIPGMSSDQLTAHLRKTLERALGTSVDIESLGMKLKGSKLTLDLKVSAEDIRLQLLPLEKEADDGKPTDDLAVDA